ncbi:GMC family oxidoreductase [Cryobacterium psychrophilum]|uniref:Glucose-methanol-choline oxidoreductase n=1 Tax=Cryobacterium psychrophilum TaxID=41988 RepID=A0A4Y8KI86_9MICO|nr:GMC family oxidoreductase N-terminal domain-containing protein [Cryobacterium psychrophilum]TDW28436.1 choline dehydrogenase [Cryobacterium psychrophilum]TFD75114.1 glucose-methanol-choline oxidoreductase [Cryobacterium psychrophilum]
MTAREDGSFDYVVVGAGSAGAALANRLSADPSNSVVLLEAGGNDKNPNVHIPAAFSGLFKTDLDWNYETTPQPGLRGRTVYGPRGKVLGGSSSLNAMMWVRGFAADYDRWADLAGPGWSYESLLPIFKRVERVQSAIDPEHGNDGAISVEHQRSPRDLTGTFLHAVTEAGYAVVPPNSRQPEGFSQTMLSQKKGSRHSTVDGYLTPVKARKNLVVRTGTEATRVLFEGTRAVGVEYSVAGELHRVAARREVILCGGAVNTPQLLMLSGIGDPAQLTAVGIPVLVDSPEVGANLRDHLVSFFAVETPGGTLLTATALGEVGTYLLRRRGMLTSNVAEAYGFVRSSDDVSLPDLEIIFAPAAYVDEGLAGIPRHGISLGPILIQPKSTGTVTLASANPLDKPIIDPRYLSDPGGEDRAVMMRGLAIAERILMRPAMKAVSNGKHLRPMKGEQLDSTARAAAALNSLSHTLYHPTSTVRMGSDASAPVDGELRVRGVQGLRVADASVMPQIIRGHTNAPAIVIGEKAADLIIAAARAGLREKVAAS